MAFSELWSGNHKLTEALNLVDVLQNMPNEHSLRITITGELTVRFAGTCKGDITETVRLNEQCILDDAGAGTISYACNISCSSVKCRATLRLQNNFLNCEILTPSFQGKSFIKASIIANDLAVTKIEWMLPECELKYPAKPNNLQDYKILINGQSRVDNPTVPGSLRVFYNDELKISATASEGYEVDIFINGNNYLKDSICKIQSGIEIEITSHLKPYILSLYPDNNTFINAIKKELMYYPPEFDGCHFYCNGYRVEENEQCCDEISIPLNSNDVIKYGEILYVSAEAASGYEIESLTINGSIFTSGFSYRQVTVAGDVTVSSVGRVVYELKKSIVGYGNITILRAGIAYNDNRVYPGDVLSVSGSATNLDYEIESLTINGTKYTSSFSNIQITVSGNVTISLVTKIKTYSVSLNPATGTSISVLKKIINSYPAEGNGCTFYYCPDGSEPDGDTCYSVTYVPITGNTVTSGDVIVFRPSSENNYDLLSMTVNGTKYTSNYEQIELTVKGDISVSTESQQNVFNLSLAPGTNTNINVRKKELAYYEPEFDGCHFYCNGYRVNENEQCCDEISIPLNNNAAIKRGEILFISAGASSGYEVQSLTINGETYTNGFNDRQVAVASNVTVSSVGRIVYNLSKSIIGYGNLTILRGGNIYSDNRIYPGDVLTISAAVTSNDYEIESLTINGTKYTSSFSNIEITVSGNITISLITRIKTYSVSLNPAAGTSISVLKKVINSYPAEGNGCTFYYCPDGSEPSGDMCYSVSYVPLTGNTVTSGEIIVFRVSCENNYELLSMTVNGTKYTLNYEQIELTVNGNIAISTVSRKNTFNLLLSPGANTYINVYKKEMGYYEPYDAGCWFECNGERIYDYQQCYGEILTPLSNNAVIKLSDILVISAGASAGYSLTSMAINGTNYTSGAAREITVSGDVTVTSAAAMVNYTLTKTVGSNASLTILKNGSTFTGSTVNYGDVLTVTASVTNSNYEVESLIINGSSTGGFSRQITVTGNTTVSVTAKQTTYTLTKTVGSNAVLTVSRNGSAFTDNVIYKGETITVSASVTDSNIYEVDTLTINGTSYTSGFSRQVTVAGNVTTGVTAKKRVYTLTKTIASYTSLTVLKNGTNFTGADINYGDVLTFSASVTNSDYEVESLTINGTKYTSGFSNKQITATGNVTVSTTNRKVKFKLTISPGANTGISVSKKTYGYYEPYDAGCWFECNGERLYDYQLCYGEILTPLSNNAVVNRGDVLVVSAWANAGSNLISLTISGTSYTSGFTLEITVADDVAVSTAATAINYTLTKTIGSNASLTILKNGSTFTGSTVNYGDILTVNASVTNSNAYEVESLTINGTKYTSGFSNRQFTVYGNTTIAVAAKPYKLTKSLDSYTSMTVLKNGASFTGTDIVIGDVLTFSASSTNSNYEVESMTINGTKYTSGFSNRQFTATGNVTVSVAAKYKAYTVSISAAAGTTISINKIIDTRYYAEGDGCNFYCDGYRVDEGTLCGGSLTYQPVANGGSVNYGDRLQISASASGGYSLISLTINGTVYNTDFSNREITVTGNVTVSTQSRNGIGLSLFPGSNTYISVVKRVTEYYEPYDDGCRFYCDDYDMWDYQLCYREYDIPLSNNASLNIGDALYISVWADSGYTVKSLTINGTTYTSGFNRWITVTGNTTISTSR